MPEIQYENFHYFIHLGYPKAGSTFLQKQVFNQVANYEGVGAFSNDLMGVIFNEPFDVLKAQTLKRRLIKDVNEKTAIISHELILLPRLHDEELLQRFRKRSLKRGLVIQEKINEEQPCKNLKTLFPEGKIILVIRNQFDITLSEFAHRLREDIHPWNNIRNMHRFFAETFVSKLYDQTIQMLYQIFGKENVLVLPFELLNRQPEKFVESITRFTGFNFQLINYKPENTGTYEYAAVLKLRFQKRMERLRQSNFAGIRFVSDFIYNSILSQPLLSSFMYSRFKKKYGNQRVTADEKIKKEFAPFFAQSNMRTQELTGINLAEFGYCMSVN